jgi:hypothetical protein
MQQTLITHQTITAIVEGIEAAKRQAAQAFALLTGARETLRQTLGEAHAYDHLWEHNISDYNMAANAEKTAQRLEENGWRYLFDQTQMRQFLTERKRQEFDKQFYDHNLPPLTVANAASTLLSMAHDAPGNMQAMVTELFEVLRPWNTQHKTNKRWQVGKKVILTHIVNVGYFAGLNHYREGTVRTLGTVFALLDGQGIPQYPHDLATTLQTALQAHEPTCETPYFACKWYKNGNLHVMFRRYDLVDRLNALGSDASLPGAAD